MLDAQFIQLLLAGLGTGGIYAMIAVGFNIIFKSTGALNFAQGEWVMMGGLFAAVAVSEMPVWQACLLATAAVTLVGWLSDRVVIRPLRNHAPLTLTLVSVGLAIASKSLVMLTLGKNPQGYPGLSGARKFEVLGAHVDAQTLWILAITVVLMLLTHVFFAHTRYGTALRAACANPEAAALVGISHRGAIAASFALAALYGGLAGAIITPMTLMSYDSGAMLGFKAFSAAMLGGLGNLYGALLGGLLLGVLETSIGGYLTTQFKDGVAFLVLLLILTVRPQGILGRPDVVKV
ncbi:branched-chain amino acid ABC transporter permease [Achromobacter marplatensis]|jgi:branched-chain amino acid transport system permease protein|uniref:Amino acid/amide ABC transporter membrane protein 1 (HAAT family) n=1 Tax=Achromobacter marplatensis TaxID=470868 RepID=A0ABX9GLN6_9BURK|nr:branched-chain amino acid ABC transporter permease [Achromobacter marplatensis]OWT72496.1 branched-chain amino acid ABC transporter permease [Achromobacter marplatensis]RBP24201.1 amino acid/amide ABC transporter membrane protein 1 (HAAT family) [Achromobacter marplatensis]CAB3627804.1 High-affinity branched-chain amino acid transport system permease protein LivH [Achromobacter marplatensis]